MRLTLILIMVGTLTSCSHFVNSEYILEKKYPLDIPSLRIKFLTDSTGLITGEKDSNGQSFGFDYRKHFILITSAGNETNLISLQRGDTIVYHKNNLYLFDKNKKLIFNKLRNR